MKFENSAHSPLKRGFLIPGIVAAVLVMGVMVYSVLGGGMDVRSKASDSMKVHHSWQFRSGEQKWTGSPGVSLSAQKGFLEIKETNATQSRYIQQKGLNIPTTGNMVYVRMRVGVTDENPSNFKSSKAQNTHLTFRAETQWRGYENSSKGTDVSVGINQGIKEYLLPVQLPVKTQTQTQTQNKNQAEEEKQMLRVAQQLRITWEHTGDSVGHTYRVAMESIELVSVPVDNGMGNVSPRRKSTITPPAAPPTGKQYLGPPTTPGIRKNN